MRRFVRPFCTHGYYQQRLEMLKSSQVDPYPYDFVPSIGVAEFKQKYSDLSAGESNKEVQLRLAGRLQTKRKSGSKLFFYDLQSEGHQVQIMSSISRYESPVSKKVFKFNLIHSM